MSSYREQISKLPTQPLIADRRQFVPRKVVLYDPGNYFQRALDKMPPWVMYLRESLKKK